MIITTLSFRSAYMMGVSHLAGQPVTLTFSVDGGYDVSCRGERIGGVTLPTDVRKRGGIPRDDLQHIPASRAEVRRMRRWDLHRGQ